MKRISFLLIGLCIPFMLALIGDSTPSVLPKQAEDLQVDAPNDCVFQATSKMVLGEVTCDANFALSIQTNANHNGAIKIDHVAQGAFQSAVAINVDATGVGAFEFPAVHSITVDTADSNALSGMAGVRVFQTGTGGIDVRGVLAGPGVGPVLQASATAGLAFVDTAKKFDDSASTFTTITSEAADVGTNVDLFDEVDDIVYIGADAAFDTIEFNLAINAGASITPTFEFFNGTAFTSFAPVDGTSGMTSSGQISYEITALTGWEANIVDGDNKFWIRIIRTNGTVNPLPKESTIRQAAIVQYNWNEDGDLVIRAVTSNDIDTDTVHLKNQSTTLGTCDASTLGEIKLFISGNNTGFCGCAKTGASTFAWQNLSGALSCP